MKFLATKLAALQSELKASREIFREASAEVDKMFSQKYYPEQETPSKEKEKSIQEFSEEEARKQNKESSNPEEPPEDLPDQDSASKDADPEVRKMFKKIAAQCHPDKLEDLEDGVEKRKKQDLYNRARAALEDNDVVSMADVANDLGVDTPEITELHLKQTEDKIIAIKKQLNKIESTLVWHWFFTESKEKKDKLLKKLFGLMHANNPRP
jgi:hypothetical protein